jgi:hypothetical protein
MNQNPYPLAFRLNTPEWIAFGAGGENSDALQYLLAWNLTKEQKYLDAANLNFYTTIGVNPLSMSFITGVGDKYPLNPLQGQSGHDNLTEPIPGFVIPGPASHMDNGLAAYFGAQKDANNYPSLENISGSYPILRRYADEYNLVKYNESTIYDMAGNYAVFPILGKVSNTACTPNWVVTAWTPADCLVGQTQTKTYIDINYCEDNSAKPADETRTCLTGASLVTTITPNGGNFTAPVTISVTLSSNDPSNIIYYCLGDACTPDQIYSSPLSLTSTTTVRYYSKDTAGNQETVKSATFTFCSTNCTTIFTKTLKLGMRGPEVMALQKFLNNNGYDNKCVPVGSCKVSATGPGSLGHETSTFSLKTWAAVKRFQTYYKADILTPNGLTRATGLVARATLAKINSLINPNP